MDRPCRSDDEGNLRCFRHYLDTHWCIVVFSEAPSDPCDGHHYSRAEIDSVLSCIQALSCSALGLPRGQKALSGEQRPPLDRYTCPDGTSQRWTATICDNGILAY